MRRSGVVGLIGGAEVAGRLMAVLAGLQHRGQAACVAMVEGRAADGSVVHAESRHRGLVKQLPTPVLSGVEGSEGALAGLGIVSATRSMGRDTSTEPFSASSSAGQLALVVSGALTNDHQLRAELEAEGQAFVTEGMSELIATHVAAHLQRGHTPLESLTMTLRACRGAWALVLLHDGRLLAARDPAGVRPLCLGRTADGGWVVTSESSGFALADVIFERDIAPGEVVALEAGMEPRTALVSSGEVAHCSREWVYFARPDAWLDGTRVIQARRVMGLRLAKEAPVGADIVVPVPDSGRSAASGFADGAQLPLVEAMHRNRYVQEIRRAGDESARTGLRRAAINVAGSLVEGRRVVLVDDSMVGGHTMKRLVAMVRERGAASVDVRIAAPPLIRPCRLGIDLPQERDLAVHRADDLTDWIGADSLRFLSPEGLAAAVGHNEGLCFACSGRAAPESTGWTEGHPMLPSVEQLVAPVGGLL